MAELRGLAVEYEVPIPKSVQQTAEKVDLGQLQTKIKVRLTTKNAQEESLCYCGEPKPCSGKFPSSTIRHFKGWPR